MITTMLTCCRLTSLGICCLLLTTKLRLLLRVPRAPAIAMTSRYRRWIGASLDAVVCLLVALLLSMSSALGCWAWYPTG